MTRRETGDGNRETRRELGDGNREADANHDTTPPGVISRRRALTILGSVPVAAAIGQVPQTQTPVNPPATSPNPGVAAVVGAPRAPRFFNQHEWRTLRVLVD